MFDTTKAFRRHNDGSWRCVAAITIEHPKGRIQVAPGTVFTPGTVFMGVDMAGWLDEQRLVRSDYGGASSPQPAVAQALHATEHGQHTVISPQGPNNV